MILMRKLTKYAVIGSMVAAAYFVGPKIDYNDGKLSLDAPTVAKHDGRHYLKLEDGDYQISYTPWGTPYLGDKQDLPNKLVELGTDMKSIIEKKIEELEK